MGLGRLAFRKRGGKRAWHNSKTGSSSCAQHFISQYDVCLRGAHLLRHAKTGKMCASQPELDRSTK